jgi:CheY-like chemotaxis protein/HPt (histidine-containing phosphotransfer) domain-containing protein
LDASTTKLYGGTGLGLSISKQLVEMMGGEIGVYSNPGFGSTFWFSFLTKRSESKVLEVVEPENLKHGIERFINITPSILVVDDNLVNRDVAGEILKKCGCKVELASNGIEAVFLAKKNDYDIIFMDIQMPEMDGIEANRQIKNLDKAKQPLVVAMTAYSLKEDEERFLASGLDDYLAKPIRAHQLISKVEQLLIGSNETVKKMTIDTSARQTLNNATLEQLEKYGGHEMVVTALKEFEEEAANQLKECDSALKEEDYSTIRKHLHTLKGSAGTLGVEKVARISENLEAGLKKKDYSGLEQGLVELNNNFAEFREFFSNIISD